MNLWLLELPESSSVDGSAASCDCSLTCEFPLSPSSQLMYESEPLRDQCYVVGCSQPDQPGLQTGVISPSVERLMFTDSDVFQYMFADNQLQPAAAAGSSSAEAAGGSAVSDAWKITESGGPTLTQLNSDDLDTTFLDDFSVSSGSFCVDCTQQQQPTVASSSTTSVPPAGATLPCWSELARPRREASAVQQRQQQAVVSCSASLQQHVDDVQQCGQTHTAPSSTSSMQFTLDRCWEAIDSFLKSEDARMATEASNRHQQMRQLATDIKTEPRGILICAHFQMN